MASHRTELTLSARERIELIRTTGEAAALPALTVAR